MRIYVAGPMRGHVGFNFPAFHEASLRLELLGHRVVNPAAMDEVYGFDPMSDPVTPELVRQCVRRDVEAITSVDAVVMLPGWQQSKGATAERAVALWLGLPVCELEEVDDEWHH